MSEQEVFICRKDKVTRRSLADLRKAGIVVVEIEDDGDIDRVAKFIRSGQVVSAFDLTWAALKALMVDDGYGNKGEKQREEFTRVIFSLLDQNDPLRKVGPSDA